jgi:hypothetical protein
MIATIEKDQKKILELLGRKSYFLKQETIKSTKN